MNAFAHKAGRTGNSNMEDRILAHLTLLGTSLCVETWLEDNQRDLDAIVSDVFSSMAAVCLLKGLRTHVV